VSVEPGSRGFASDNEAGAHPAVLDALAAANAGHQPSYGDDEHSARLREVMRAHFGPQAEVFPVLTGTGANVIALQAVLARHEAAICADTAHVHVDEGAAPERAGGIKLLTVAAPDGKLTPELVGLQAWGFGDQHHAQAGAVSLTQATEYGTVYSPDELAALCADAHHRGMRVHVDGARLANAAASLGVTLRAITTDVGVDIVSLGGTKAGLLIGEAVVVLDPAYTANVAYLRKGAMQLASKTRFIAAQLVALYDGDLWLDNATHANAMARRLAAGVHDLPGVTLTRPVEANAVFAVLPADVTRRLQQRVRFHVWSERTGEVRWMTAWDTTPDDVNQFVRAIREEFASASST
jgi:threonine aldolase